MSRCDAGADGESTGLTTRPSLLVTAGAYGSQHLHTPSLASAVDGRMTASAGPTASLPALRSLPSPNARGSLRLQVASRFWQDTSQGRLFGRIAPTRWLVAGAKGRSNGMESSLRQTLIDQKATVKTIAGHRPAVALGCVASFPILSGGVRGPLRVDAFDPEPAKEAVDLNISEARFFQTYYEPFTAAIDAGQQTDGPPGYVAASLDAAGLRVGMRRDLYEAVQPGYLGENSPWTELLGDEDFQDDRQDGTFVQAEYGEAMSLRDSGA